MSHNQRAPRTLSPSRQSALAARGALCAFKQWGIA